MTTRLYLALAVLAGLIMPGAAPAVAADKLENIPLIWKPTTSMASWERINLTGLENVKLQIDPFTDTREDTALIGQNKEKIPMRKVTTQDDVARFVTYQMKRLISGLGVEVVENGGTVIMKGEIAKFYVEETSRYNSEVELRVFLTDPAGKALWGYNTIGTSRRYGMSYKADNYYEVLSDALIAATHELVRNPKFRDALRDSGAK